MISSVFCFEVDENRWWSLYASGKSGDDLPGFRTLCSKSNLEMRLGIESKQNVCVRFNTPVMQR